MKHTFKDAYAILLHHAHTLREQTEPDIDDLLQIVEESVQAYKTCQRRIDAVEKALDKALASTAHPTAPVAAPATPAALHHPDDAFGPPF